MTDQPVRFGVGRTYKEAAEDAGVPYTPPRRPKRSKGACDLCPATAVMRRTLYGWGPNGEDLWVCKYCYREQMS